MDRPTARADASLADAAAALRRPRGRPRKTAAERDDGNRRAALLKAAAKLFRRKGFDATSTRDIAAAVGMRSGSPFYHFKSKGELLYAVMEEGMRAGLERQRAALAEAQARAPRDARAQLRALVRSHFDVLLGPGSDFIPVMLYEARSLPARQRAVLARLQGEYEALWIPLLEQLHRSGPLKGRAKLVRLMMFGALNWSVKWFDAKKGASLDELADAAMDLFAGGAR